MLDTSGQPAIGLAPSWHQLELLPTDVAVSRGRLPLINYLGSKRRLVGQIAEALRGIAPNGVPVCDLFAGSGAVSVALAEERSVIANDIQEFSRVLCSALLHPPSNAPPLGRDVVAQARAGELRRQLRAALSDVIRYERLALAQALRGDVEPLADLVEQGSLIGVAVGLEPASATLRKLLPSVLKRLEVGGLAAGPDTLITRYFGGVYFSWEQAADLDSLLSVIHAGDPLSRDYVLAAVLAAASDIVNTVGKQFAQPIRPRDALGQPKRHLVRQTIRDRSTNVFGAYQSALGGIESLRRLPGKHQALRADFREVLENRSLDFGAVYADPPYTRDHYSRFYHVLETMSLHDEPAISTTMIRSGSVPRLSRGLYRADRHQSPFSIKSQAPEAFSALCRGVAARRIPMILSYSPYSLAAGHRPRLMTVAEVSEIAHQSFGQVTLRPLAGVNHRKLNLTSRNVKVLGNAEILLICKP